MTDKQNLTGILVLGGGFAGLNAAIAARRVLEKEAPVTMVSRDPWLTIRPRLYEADPNSLKVPLPELLSRIDVRFVEGSAMDFDVGASLVHLSDGRHVGYGRLVVATGSFMRPMSVPGSETAFSIDDLSCALKFDERLKSVARKPSPCIVVIGAGFTGLELALEMRDRLVAHGARNAAVGARVVLMDRSAQPGESLGVSMKEPIARALSAAAVECILGTEVVGLSPDTVRFHDGSSFKADAVVLCTGLTANPLTEKLPSTRDEAGRLICDQYLRVSELPAVFAAGDAARVEVSPGRLALFSCQHALQMGKVAGENAALDLLGLSLTSYRQERYVTCLDLGRSGAVLAEGWDRSIRLVGQEAKAVKKRINTELIYPVRGSVDAILASSRTGKTRPIVHEGAAAACEPATTLSCDVRADKRG